MDIAVLKGYYGMRNAGDDAFLAVAAWAARTYCRCGEVYAAAARVPHAQIGSVRPCYLPWPGLGTWNRRRYSALARSARVLIWGGGSILHTEQSLRRDVGVLDRVRSATAFAAGVSVGPFRTAGAESACADFLEHLSFVGVRDEVSYRRAVAIAPRANVHLTWDLAPLLRRASGCQAANGGVPRAGLGIALCNYERFVHGDVGRESARIRIVAEAVRRSACKGAIDKVVLLDFNAHRRMGDHQVHCELARQIDGAVPVEHLRYRDDPLALMESVARLKGILAMRLHAAIFAFCTRTPLVLLAYHEKCGEWGKLAGISPQHLLDVATLDSVEVGQQIEALMEGRVPLGGVDIAAAEEQSLRNWSWLSP